MFWRGKFGSPLRKNFSAVDIERILPQLSPRMTLVQRRLQSFYHIASGCDPVKGHIDRPHMNLRHVAFLTALLSPAFDASLAQAQTRVGEAVIIQNEVVRVAGSAATQISVGDGMLRDEIVRTGADSAARFVMADSTNLSLGPGATLTLDRTVFNDEHSYRDVAVRLTTGAFRFVTGHSEKTAYKITTPLATIGVRVTTLDILSQRGRSVVVLQEGAATVCTLSYQCIQLTQPGDTAIITATGGRTAITKRGTPPWTFAATCTAVAGLCSVNQYANASPTIAPAIHDDGMLCGR
jgi:hypothetical protein